MQQMKRSTRMDLGLMEAKNLFQTQELKGPSRRVVIILTDGVPDDEQKAIHASDELKIVFDVDVMCLGVGEYVNEKIIKLLASSDDMGGCVSQWDDVKDTIEELMGLSSQKRDTIRVSAKILNRPVAIGQPVKFQVTLINRSSECVPKNSTFKFLNQYFDLCRHVIPSDINEDGKYTFEIELETLDNVSIHELEETIPFEILNPKKVPLMKGAVTIWVSDFCGSLISYLPQDVPMLNIGLFGTHGQERVVSSIVFILYWKEVWLRAINSQLLLLLPTLEIT